MAPYENNGACRTDLELLNEQQLSQLLGCSRSKLQRDRVLGVGIPFIKGKGKRSAIRYSLKEVQSWLQRHQRQSTSQEV